MLNSIFRRSHHDEQDHESNDHLPSLHPNHGSSSSRCHPSPRQIQVRRKVLFSTTALLFLFFTLSTTNQHFTLQAFLREMRNLVCGSTVDWSNNDPTYVGPWNENYNTNPYSINQQIYFSDERTASTNDPPVLDINMHVGYVLTFLTCPGNRAVVDTQYEPDGAAFYDAAAVFRQTACYAASPTYDCAVYAIMHPEAIRCQNPEGSYYDRVKILEELGYYVRIWSEPATLDSIRSTYLRDNVDSLDVGILDNAKLHAFRFTRHSMVILMDFSAVIMKPIDSLLDLLKSDARNAALVTNANNGVDTGFYVLKPSDESFEDLVDKYRKDYDDTNGWGGLGIKDFPGSLGTSGLLKYYHDLEDNPAIPMDRCKYANDLLGSCKTTAIDSIWVGKMMDVCGAPWDCYVNPAWEDNVHSRCKAYFYQWFTYRIDFEDTTWFQGMPIDRTGTYHPEFFRGYCSAEGKEGYKPMIPDNRLCEGTTCPVDQFLTNDCQCVSDPCLACPSTALCQNNPGYPIMCIDCSCGFCNYEGSGCCKFNDNNNCVAGTNDQECKGNNDFFSAWGDSGQICSGVELSLNAVPNGCGCQPSSVSACTYSDRWRTEDEKCFICTANDLVKSDDLCGSCKTCLENCGMLCVGTSFETAAMESCLGSGNKATQNCRASCSTECNKINQLL